MGVKLNLIFIIYCYPIIDIRNLIKIFSSDIFPSGCTQNRAFLA